MIKDAIYGYINKGRVLVDALLIIGAFLVSFWLRFAGDVPQFNFAPFKKLWFGIAFLGLVSLWLVGLYEDKRRKPWELLRLTALSSLLTMLLTIGFLYLMDAHSVPRTVLVLNSLVLTVFLFAWRYSLSRMQMTKRVLIVGDNGETESIVPKFESFIGEQSFQIVGILTSEQLPLSSQMLQGTDIICVSSSVSHELRERIMIDSLQWNIELYMIPRLCEIMLKGAESSRLDDSMYFKVKPLGMNPVQRFVKRTFDLFLVMVGLALGWWLFPIIALAIRLDSPGPVVFSQVRVGRDGTLFKVHKFRTMVDNAERSTGPVMATADDPRITRVGEFIRKTRLDEIPQLYNVLKGEMSFVGPRPERPVFASEYSEKTPIFRYRVKVKPGITGLAQVEGNYSTEFRDKLRFDLYYIRNYSVFLDMQIIFQTLHVVLNSKKAKGKPAQVQLGRQQAAATQDELNADETRG